MSITIRRVSFNSSDPDILFNNLRNEFLLKSREEVWLYFSLGNQLKPVGFVDLQEHKFLIKPLTQYVYSTKFSFFFADGQLTGSNVVDIRLKLSIFNAIKFVLFIALIIFFFAQALEDGLFPVIIVGIISLLTVGSLFDEVNKAEREILNIIKSADKT